MTSGLLVSAAAFSDGREPQAVKPRPTTVAAIEAARTLRRETSLSGEGFILGPPL
jgi:hypothetical protein